MEDPSLGVLLRPPMVEHVPTAPSPRFLWSRCAPIWLVLVVAIFIAASAGCSSQYVKLRKAPKNPLTDQLSLTAWSGPTPSERTTQMLRRCNALEDLDGDPQKLVEKFQGFCEREPAIELAHATSELAYIAGKKIEGSDEQAALECFEKAVAYAYLYLFDERYGPARNPYDPQFRGACDLYNTALESALRICKKNGQLVPGTTHVLQSRGKPCELKIVLRSQHWHDEDFERFEFVSDYALSGLTNQYQTFGLGVPMIAVRKQHPASDPAEKYYPPDLSFPVTAFLRVAPPQHVTKDGPVLTAYLELYDPLESSDVEVAGRRVPLESDGSTALAYYLSNPQLKLDSLSTIGLVRPDLVQPVTGLSTLR